MFEWRQTMKMGEHADFWTQIASKTPIKLSSGVVVQKHSKNTKQIPPNDDYEYEKESPNKFAMRK